MPVIIRSFLYQFFHYLNRLDLRLKIELTVLFLIFTVFFTQKSIDLLNLLQQKFSISADGITMYIALIVTGFITLTTPFIYTHLIPRQNHIQALRVYPLDSRQSFLILFGVYVKYEIIALVFLTPVTGAMLVKFHFIFTSFLLFWIILQFFILFMFVHILAHTGVNRQMVYAIYFLSSFAYFIICGYFFSIDGIYYSISAIISILIAVTLWTMWTKIWPDWDKDVMRIRVIRHKSKSSVIGIYCYPIYHMQRRPFFALVMKEILAYIRNPGFMRMKISGILVYLFTLLSGTYFFPADRIIFISTVTVIYLWIHYTHQFNEKYVIPDSAFFLKTFPLRYSQIWAAKFIAEIFFLVPLFLFLPLILMISGIDRSTALNIVSSALLFALFILSTIISVKIMFYDNPRKAGYVYHFMIIFSFVMVYHYYLVGPVIIFFLLIYLTYLSYQQFAR